MIIQIDYIYIYKPLNLNDKVRDTFQRALVSEPQMPYACAFPLFPAFFTQDSVSPFFFPGPRARARGGAWGADAGHVAVAVGAWQGSSKGPSAQGYRAQPWVGGMG